MGHDEKQCERSVGEMAAPEVEDGSESTRAAEKVSNFEKRRKIDDSEMKNFPEKNSADSPVNSTTSSLVMSHEVSSDNVVKSSSLKRLGDLKSKNSETEISTFAIGDFSKTSPSSVLYGGDSGEVMESTTTNKKSSSPEKVSAAKMLSAEEIEEFFGDHEKNQQKRFAEKYNYDFVKDVPLEGRFEWITLKR